MKRSTWLSVLVALLLMSFAATNAMAMMNPTTGRFMQADPLGYPDGMNRYGAYHVMHGGVDPSGLEKSKCPCKDSTGEPMPEIADDAGAMCCRDQLHWFEVWVRSPSKFPLQQLMDGVPRDQIESGHTFMKFPNSVGQGCNQRQPYSTFPER